MEDNKTNKLIGIVIFLYFKNFIIERKIDLQMYYVYLHKNKTNGKMYCGITSMKPTERWHGGSGYSRNKHFYNAIKKYGWNGFDHDILYECSNEENACALEKFITGKLKLTNREFGYNNREGGGSRGKHTEETKQKLREKHLGKKASFELKQKFSEERKGSKNGNSILTEDQVLEIRKLRFLCNRPVSKVYELYINTGISFGNFISVWQYQNWNHVGQEYNTEEVRLWHKRHGRAKGEKASSSKLTNQLVEKLKLEYICGASISFLENKYSITKSAIYKILDGKSYKDVRVDLNLCIKYIKENKFILSDVIWNLYSYGIMYDEISEILNVSKKTIISAIYEKKKQIEQCK